MDAPADAIHATGGTLATLLGRDLEVLLRPPPHLPADPEHAAHLPLVNWLMAVLRPRVLVELGVRARYSCSVLSDAAIAEGLGTTCYAVDSRPAAASTDFLIDGGLGIAHAHCNGVHARLFRCSLAAALAHITDGSVDLLLLDLRQAAGTAREMLARWLPKLSDRAVVLLQGADAGEQQAGLWPAEFALRPMPPCFVFPDARGLAVLGFGQHVPAPIGALCRLAEDPDGAVVRQRFAQLGERWRLELQMRLAATEREHQRQREAVLLNASEASERAAREAAAMRARAAQRAEAHRRTAAAAHAALDQATAAAAADRAAARTEAARLRLEIARVQHDVARADARTAERAARVAELRGEHARLRAEIDGLNTRIAGLNTRIAGLNTEIAWLRRPLAQRVMGRLRRLGGFLPRGVRRRLFRAGQLAFWAATLRLRTRLAQEGGFGEDLRLLRTTRLFDAAWYSARNPDVGWSGMDPALHYLMYGRHELRDPGPDFDAAWYMQQNAQAIPPGSDPLLYHLRHGAAEGRPVRPRGQPEPAPEPDLPLPAPAEPPPHHDELQIAAPSPRRVVYVSGEPETPGHIYRVLRPMAALAQIGARVAWFTLPEAAASPDEILAADVVVIWRTPWSDLLKGLLRTARDGGAQVVFDLDDLMVEPDLANPALLDALRTLHIAEADARDHYKRMRHASNAADFCLASTDELAWHFRLFVKPTFVLPNGFDEAARQISRRAARQRRLAPGDGLLRIGYAGGTRTHQRDFGQVAEAVGRILRERPDCRLVLFAYHADRLPILDPAEYPALAGLGSQIEWRLSVPVQRLPEELARFDVNLAPLEAGNPFCEAKSELKYFEAALVDVCTVASPTGPYRRAIAQGRTGLLAASPEAWYDAITLLLDQPALRRRLARAAYLDVLWRFGPERRREMMASVLEQVSGGREAARAFALDVRQFEQTAVPPAIPETELLFAADRLGDAAVTVVVPLYNYAHHVEEALGSVLAQTLPALDLVVVDDASTDASLSVALAWAERHAGRFNRIAVLRNAANCGLGPTRNAGFAAAETPFVLPLDADNRLLAPCCEILLREAHKTGAAFVYPAIREFGEASGLLGMFPYVPARLVGVPYIDAMALVSVAAWAAVGGYRDARLGWEDYDFWCCMAEHGLMGHKVEGEALAEYRVHRTSMLRTITEDPQNKLRVLARMQRRHPWLSLVDARRLADAAAEGSAAAEE